MIFKVGDWIKYPAWDDYFQIEQISSTRVWLRLSSSGDCVEYSRDWVEKHCTLRPEPPAPLDLTKPLQTRSGRPMKLIGQTSDGRRIVLEDPDGCILEAPISGQDFSTPRSTDIVNTPPPSIWPVKRWFVMYQNTMGKAQISGQCLTKDLAEIYAQRRRGENYKDVTIQEVTFDPSSKS